MTDCYVIVALKYPAETTCTASTKRDALRIATWLAKGPRGDFKPGCEVVVYLPGDKLPKKVVKHLP
jgi:hypothetical protein